MPSPRILTIGFTENASFSGARTLSADDRFGFNWQKQWTLPMSAITDLPVGPDWLFSYGVTKANIVDPFALPFPALSEIWDNRGFCELPDTEVICMTQTMERGPYRGSLKGRDATGATVTYTGCRYDCTFGFQTYLSPLLQGAPSDPVEQPSPDPVEWIPYTTVSPVENDTALAAARFLGYYEALNDSCDCVQGSPTLMLEDIDNTVFKLTKGTCGPLLNSVGLPFDHEQTVPQQMKEFVTHKFRPFYTPDQFKCFEGTVNKTTFALNHPWLQFFVVFQPHTVLLVHVAATPNVRVFRSDVGVITSRSYWEWEYKMMFNPRGWYLNYRNDSLMRPHIPFIDPPDKEDHNLTPITTTIVSDGQGPPDTIPVEKPVRIDRYGFPKAPDATTGWMRYLAYPESDFNSQQLQLTLPF